MKSVLIHLTDGQGVETCGAYGLALADGFGAKVGGLFAIPALASTFWGYEAAEFLPVLEEQLQKSAKIAIDRFQALAAHRSRPVETKIVDQAFLSTFTAASLAVDLLVTPQPKPSPDSVVELEFQAPDLVVGCACPILVVPRNHVPSTVGKRICIAWNDSRESSRAVRDALPLLRAAQTVVVIGVHTGKAEACSFKAVSEYLDAHGIAHSTATATAHDHAVTETILERVAQSQGDLIVMGAWGHSRIRELVLGGVTRGILEQMTVPVLLSH